MKCVLAILALFASSAFAVSHEELLNQFSGFKAKFGKVYPSQEAASDRPSNGKEGGGGVEGGVYEQLNKQLMLQRAMRQYQEHFIMSAQEKERERGRERQLSGHGRARQNSGQERGGGGGVHLSGEQIRKLRENQKQQVSVCQF